MIMGFIIHFYITFGTNLIIGGPARIAVFLPFQYFEGKEYQTESKRNETFGNVIFSPNMVQETWTTSRHKRGGHETRGRAHPPRRALPSRGPLEAPPTDFFRLYIPIYPKNIEYEDRSGVLLPQASVATKNLSGARSGTIRDPITGGHLHHPGALHDEEGVVHPRG